MKKLLLTALIAISPMTFAKDFNADLLIGEWQCKSESSFDNSATHYTQTAKQRFYKNGTYTSEDLIYNQNLDETIKSKGKGNWYIKDNILNMNTEDILTLTTDKPFYTNTNDLKESLMNDHKFSQFILKEFSKDKFVVTLSEQAQQDAQGNTIDTCQRIK
ncbi:MULTISPECIES: hypothetical protein [unclassified Moraxella]|uniref:hypothetical protein n=1 Tax=unclassified Moraxella TaxID=2685852 RepID=UPI003AF5CE83